MSRLQAGGLAKCIKSDDDRNIGKIVSLYAFHEEYMGYKNVWLFDCNDGFYVNGNLRFTRIGSDDSDGLIPLDDKQTQDELAKEKELEPSF